MQITLLDDSIPYEGSSPTRGPLGGFEKSVVGLAGALARRGHEVIAYTRCHEALDWQGVSWQPWDAPRPAATDLLIAARKPSLLGEAGGARLRVLWLGGPAQDLDLPSNRTFLERYQPVLVFSGQIHLASATVSGFRAAVIEPAVGEAYREVEREAPEGAATAIVTTHPLHDLNWLLNLWTTEIQPRLPGARLVIYSAALARLKEGAELPLPYKLLFDRATAARDAGVSIAAPLADSGMAAVYGRARLHLYPGWAEDMFSFTLAESPACGLPAVARPIGVTGERIRDGQTGYLAPDDSAFANLAVQILGDEVYALSLSRDALALQRGRGWDQAAAEFEVLAL